MEYYKYTSPVGSLLITMEEEYLVGIEYKDDDSINNIKKLPKGKILNILDRYFNKEKVDIKEINIKLVGTEYRKHVWNELIKIPYGKVVTYKYISTALNKKGIKSSPRSVGGAVGKNPIAILIPCHRVIGSDGSITGYSGGVDKKSYLLSLERSKKGPTTRS